MKRFVIAMLLLCTMATVFSCKDDNESQSALSQIVNKNPNKPNPDKESNKDEETNKDENSGNNSSNEEENTEQEPEIIADASFSVNLSAKHQKMEGFGGAIAWLTHMLKGNPKH